MSAKDDDAPSCRVRRFVVFRSRFAFAIIALIWFASVVALRVEYLTDSLPDDEVGPMTFLQGLALVVGLLFLVILAWRSARLAYRHSGPRSWYSRAQDLTRSTNAKQYRNVVWVSRINGAMMVPFCFAGLASGIFGTLIPGTFALTAFGLAVPVFALLFYLSTLVFLWGWRTPLG